MDKLRTALVALTDTISDTPTPKSAQLVREQLLRDADSLRVRIAEANRG